MSSRLSIDELFHGIISGDRMVLSRAITLIESRRNDDRETAYELLNRILPYTGNSVRLGISGIPGVGKSTFIDAFGSWLISNQEVKLAVLAIDPSSEISKGSILGDKTRMQELSLLKNAFIRPSANAGLSGGIASRTRETILLCEAAGFNYIIVETVGVGQSETEVKSLVDFFILLMIPGAGDELQGIKRGIMEICDLILINKAEEGNEKAVNLAQAELNYALHWMRLPASGWQPLVLKCSSLQKKGLESVYKSLGEYVLFTKENGYFEKNRLKQQEERFRKELFKNLLDQLRNNSSFEEKLQEATRKLREGKEDPGALAYQLSKTFFQLEK